MSQERNRILDLLAGGKITAEEAGRLLDALEARSSESAAGTEGAGAPSPGQSAGEAAGRTSSPAKYMYVKVISTKGDNVNVKIPLGLVRAGVKLTSLIPKPAMEQINKSMADHGMSIDVLNMTQSDLEELIEALREMEVNVDNAETGDNVRVYCA